ncbi:MAG TPA: dihydrolipoyllysine-residue acetyltransferase [Anaeromyxobacteraceae bacterium]|nr:dihydrolipoyllysine-residue acetyltransferase [Anaeromyxobacteraceae bacterium]
MAPRTIEVKIPALGGFEDVPVIEVYVKPGDVVKREDSLLTLESDKATMDVPSPEAGTVRELAVKVGDRVSEGRVVLRLEAPEGAPAPSAEGKAAPPPAAPPPATPAAPAREPVGAPAAARPSAAAAIQPTPEEAAPPVLPPQAPAAAGPPLGEASRGLPHASPAVRKFARELGVDLSRVEGGGPNGRILLEDVRRFVKGALGGGAAPPPGAGGLLGLPPWPRVDHARFGPVERRALTRIQKIAGPGLARNWVMIPHVTQHDEADITELERFRVELNRENQGSGVKVTLLSFVVKACVAALKKFPEVNASLEGAELVLKRYWHIGFAADTPNGLVVPVLKNADQKGILEIATELAELAAKAREGKLAPLDIQGGSFTISSLGGIGGTAFTPIIYAPEVAILGVSRAATRPVWDGETFAPRLMLPLSLSYDHRVVDGALGARFTTFLSQVLADMRRAAL